METADGQDLTPLLSGEARPLRDVAVTENPWSKALRWKNWRFVHYQPEHDEIIKSEIKNPRKRAKKLRILTDQQAFLVQGKEIDLIGDGDAVVV